jgi:cytochrome d ubiquinol oxidase subunit II
MIALILLYAVTTLVTLLHEKHLVERFRQEPWFIAVPIGALLVIANIPREIHHGREFRAFLSSSAAIALLIALVWIGLYPNLIFSNPGPENSLTIYNAASTSRTLAVMLVIALVGMPLVLAYTAAVYWIFRGKVRIDKHSY